MVHSSLNTIVSSVTRCCDKKEPKIHHKLPKKQPQQFILKRDVFERTSKSQFILGQLEEKICHSELLKIAKSGHACRKCLSIATETILAIIQYFINSYFQSGNRSPEWESQKLLNNFIILFDFIGSKLMKRSPKRVQTINFILRF